MTRHPQNEAPPVGMTEGAGFFNGFAKGRSRNAQSTHSGT